MLKIVLIKTQNSALDNNGSAKQEPGAPEGIRLNGKVAEIKSNGTLVFATESMGSLIIADPGNLHLGDRLTIELHKDNVAAAGRLIAVNNVNIDAQNDQAAQGPIMQNQAIFDVVDIPIDSKIITQTVGHIAKLNNPSPMGLKALDKQEVGQSVDLTIMQLSTTDKEAKQLTTIASILSTGAKPENIKLQLMQKFIEADFKPDKFWGAIKNNPVLHQGLLEDEIMPAKVLNISGQRVLQTPVGQFTLDQGSEIDADIEMVLFKAPSNNAGNTTKAQLSNASAQEACKDLAKILPMMQSLKTQASDQDKYLDKIWGLLHNINNKAPLRSKAGVNFLGFINIEFDDDPDADLEQTLLENDSSAKKAKRPTIKDLEDFIKFIKDDAPNSSALKPALIKEEIWLPISLHLNGEIIDENQTKCYVKKNQQGILRFFIEVSFASLQLDGMIKLDKASNDVEEFNLIVHTLDSDNQMPCDIRNIFHQNLQKYGIKGDVAFDANLAKITSADQESFDQIIA